MDYLDAMIEAYYKEMELWKIALLPANGYEISRGSRIMESGPVDTSRPDLKPEIYESFNRHRNRAAMEAACKASQGHFAAQSKFKDELIECSGILKPNPLLKMLKERHAEAGKASSEPVPVLDYLSGKCATQTEIDWLGINREISGR